MKGLKGEGRPGKGGKADRGTTDAEVNRSWLQVSPVLFVCFIVGISQKRIFRQSRTADKRGQKTTEPATAIATTKQGSY